MQLSFDDLPEGRKLRDAALSSFDKKAWGKKFLLYARQIAWEMGQRSTSGTVRQDLHRIEVERRAREDAEPLPGDVESPVDARIWGSVFLTKDWMASGFCQTRIKGCHARPVRIWRFRNYSTLPKEK